MSKSKEEKHCISFYNFETSKRINMKTAKLEMDAFEKYGLTNTLKIKIKGGLTDSGEFIPNDFDGDGLPDDPTSPGGPGGTVIVSSNIKEDELGSSPKIIIP